MCRRASHTSCINHLLSQILEDDLFVFDCGTTIVDAVHELLGFGIHGRVTAAATADNNVGTIHLHHPITFKVEPRPSEQRLSVAASEGTVKLYTVIRGQPPFTDLIALYVSLLS